MELRIFHRANTDTTQDRDYIIILQELDTRETDLLFEHTRKLRRGGTTLLIEDRGRDRDGRPEYAFVRKRSKSRRGHSPRPVSLMSCSLLDSDFIDSSFKILRLM